MSGSYTHAGEYPAKNVCFRIYGIFERKKSSLIIFERHANLKYQYGNRHFWCKGYYVSTVGANKK